VAEQAGSLNLGEAIESFVGSQKNGGAEVRQTLSRFLRWFGDGRSVATLTPADMEAYSVDASTETLSGSDRIKSVRDFLQYSKKNGIIQTNLAFHVKLRRTPRQSRAQAARPSAVTEEIVQITAEGHAELIERVQYLKDELARNSGEIARAAADKDVRENAPLDAAKEYQAQLSTRLLVTEDTLGKAQVIDKNAATGKEVRHGSALKLQDIASGEVLEWTLVDPREADSLAQKISTSSPVGEAVLGRKLGDEVEVSAPKGTVRYKITHVN
jgi:transcription elongation factor GreA